MKKLIGALVLLSTLLIFFGFSLPDKPKPNTVFIIENDECHEWVFLCGLRIDTLIYTKAKVSAGEKVLDIFKKYNQGNEALATLKKKTKGIFDLAKVKSGDQYYIASKGDDLHTLQYFVIKKSPTEYLVCNFQDSLSAYIYSKPISIKERSVAYDLDMPLAQLLKQKKVDSRVVEELRNIFSQSIDVTRAKKGDKIKIVYTEKMVESESLGLDQIKGVIYNRGGKDYYAIPYTAYDDTSDNGYYDEKGNNLHKFFLPSPLKNGRMASRYNLHRFHPVLKVFKEHLGTDFAAPTGTPIMSTAKGVVIEAGYKVNNGNYVKIKHNNTYTTQYLHMSKIGKNMKPGTKVKQGQVIGYVGSTGLAAGPHVCYRFWKKGKQVDCLKEKLNIPNPIDGRYLKDYLSVFNDMKFKLDQLHYPSDMNPAPESIPTVVAMKPVTPKKVAKH